MLLGTAGVDPLLPTDGGIIVEIDWLKTGSFSEWGDDVTTAVRPNAQAVAVEYGRDQSTALSPTVAGRGAFTLDNRDRRFSPRNTSGPLFGKLKPASPVRITRSIGSTVFGLFNGHTDDAPINPDIGSRQVALTLVDSIADMRGLTINTALHRDLRTGEAIGLVLDACGWDADLRDLDAGATIIPWWWEDGTDALTALEKIIRSEGPPALLTVGGEGEIIFRDRHHRLTRTNSLISQGTWREKGTVEPVMSRDGFVYDEAWRNIINSATVSVDVRHPGDLTAVWTSDATITLAAGEQKILTAAASDPFLGAITPVAGTDYTVLSGSVAVRLIRTSGLSTGIELTAPSGTAAVVTALQLRAYPLTVAYTMQVSAVDSESVAEYGPRAYPGDLPWCSVGDAQAVLDIAVALRSQPLPIITARFMVGKITARALKVLPRDLSDRVTVYEPETGLAADFYIESIRHELTGEHDHAVSFGLEAVPAVPTANLFRFDVTGSGFDAGVFGGGLDLSAALFRFDVPTQGFNLGTFSS